MRVLLVASVVVDVLALAILVAPLRRRIAALEARLSPGPSHGRDTAGEAVPSPIADEKIERIALNRLPVRR
jgi:hypothetical protein